VAPNRLESISATTRRAGASAGPEPKSAAGARGSRWDL